MRQVVKAVDELGQLGSKELSSDPKNTSSWRPHIGANGISGPPGKMDEILKSKNRQKRAVF